MSFPKKNTKINSEFEIAENWLKENGDFKKTCIETRESKALNAEIVKVTYSVTFKKNNSSKTETIKGDDLKKIVIDLYRSEQG